MSFPGSFLSLLLASNDPALDDFKLKIPDLPHALEEARHILDLDQLRWALWALLALILLFLLIRWLRKKKPPAPGPPRVTQTKKFGKNPPVPEIALRITRLRQRHMQTGTFRQGCHELAALLRGFYEDLWREGVTASTVREIQSVGEKRMGAEDGGAPGRLFGLLEELQFSRRDPTADDLVAACDLAADVTSVATSTNTAPKEAQS